MPRTPALEISIQSFAHHTRLPQVGHELLLWDANRHFPLYFIISTHFIHCVLQGDDMEVRDLQNGPDQDSKSLTSTAFI